MTTRLSRSALLAATLALPVGALAQGAPPPANPADTSGTSATHPAPVGANHQPAASTAEAKQSGRRDAAVEQRIADLHSRLHISQGQEQQWEQFAGVMRDNARNMDQSYEERSQRIQQMSAVDNMRSYAQLAEAHAQDVQKLVPAFQTLYGSLSPEQKRTADQLFRSYAERSQQHPTTGHRG